MGRIRNYFLTGFIVTAPLAITAYLAWSFVGWVDSWVKPYIPHRYNPDSYLPFAVPGFGLIVALALITLVGFLTANFIGRSIVSLGENMLGRTPFVRSIYRGLKQIFETVLSNKADLFNKVALVEYPRKGVWSIVFIATEKEGEVGDVLHPIEGRTVAVFMPATPNPTTGFLMYVREDEIVMLSMSVEDAAKLIISAGLVAPEYHKKTAELAKAAAAPQQERKRRTASSRPNK
ncbi:DUF502 domain-containing protein [Mesorhizobium sp. SB112]|uniref:DUF502 domain-containing protein n=1 Tax=Mesorhizobium sp. SB112 TaxID=3151853 RepID=UPI003265B3D5